MEAGAGLEQVRSDLEMVAGRLHAAHPADYPEPQGFVTTAVPLRDELIRRAKPSLYILLGAAGFLLLIVSANVANMTLARLVRRDRELAIRATLGAGRGRLFRQLLTESTMLALIGGGVGLALAYGGLDLLVAFVSRLTARAAEVRIDKVVLGFTLAISLGTGFVVSLIPALPSRVALADELKTGGTGSTGLQRRRVRGLLIVSQVAVSFVLLVGAGLMLRTFVNLIRVDPGFDSSQVLSARLDLDWNRYTTPKSRQAFADELAELLLARPGIKSVAFTSSVPLNGQLSRPRPLIVKGRDTPEQPLVEMRVVSEDYFRVIEIPRLRGKTFFAAAEETRHVVVNATMADRYLDGVDGAVGQLIRGPGGSESWLEVIGVVGDVRHAGLGEAIDPAIYLPQSASGMRDMRILIRSAMDETNTAMLLRRLVRSIDPDQPVTAVRSLIEVRRESLASPRMTALLVGGFALLAMIITATGIAGVIAYSVSQRTREIGIRMALGAGRDSVLAMVLRQGLREVAFGLALGFIGAVVLTRILDTVLTGSGLLFGIRPTDVLTFVGVTIVLLGVALAATLAPARRATAIDPMDALRTE
jgi:predicted permease